MFTHRLLETTNGYKVIEIETNTVVYESMTPLPVAEMDLPCMYANIEIASDVPHYVIEDGHTGKGI